LLAFSAELGSADRPERATSGCPDWSALRELVERLKIRGDEDCGRAAGHLEELHARVHRASAEVDITLDRLTRVGALIEQAASKSRCIGDSEWTTVAVLDETWFKLLAAYRGNQDDNPVYRELQLLREIASISSQTIQAVDCWLGQAGTREAAMDSLWRLKRILESAGYKKPLAYLECPQSLVRAMEEAGIGLGQDGKVRVRHPEDSQEKPATGPLVKEILQAAHQTT
jgi:hypothetical protein